MLKRLKHTKWNFSLTRILFVSCVLVILVVPSARCLAEEPVKIAKEETIPGRESWKYSNLGLKTLEEVKNLLKIPEAPPLKFWKVKKRKNGGHVVKQYDEKNKALVNLQVEFGLKNGSIFY